MHLNTRGVTVHPLAQVNFYNQVVIDPQCLAECILRNFQTPIEITPQR